MQAKQFRDCRSPLRRDAMSDSMPLATTVNAIAMITNTTRLHRYTAAQRLLLCIPRQARDWQARRHRADGWQRFPAYMVERAAGAFPRLGSLFGETQRALDIETATLRLSSSRWRGRTDNRDFNRSTALGALRFLPAALSSTLNPL